MLVAEGHSELRNDLAKVLANKGLLFWKQEGYCSALTLMEEAVALLEECINGGEEHFRGLLATVTGWRDELKKLCV